MKRLSILASLFMSVGSPVYAASLPATNTAWVAGLPVDGRQKIRIEAAYSEFLKGNGEQFFLAVAQDGSRWAYRVANKDLPAANARRDALAACQLTGLDTGKIQIAGPCVIAVIDGHLQGEIAKLPVEAGFPQPGEKLDYDKIPFISKDRMVQARNSCIDLSKQKSVSISPNGIIGCVGNSSSIYKSSERADFTCKKYGGDFCFIYSENDIIKYN